MNLSDAQVIQFRHAVMPLMAFLAEHFHPHVKVILDGEHAEIVEALARLKNEPTADEIGPEPVGAVRCPNCRIADHMRKSFGGWFCSNCRTEHAPVVVHNWNTGFIAAMQEPPVFKAQ